jgi:hypothetical protein
LFTKSVLGKKGYEPRQFNHIANITIVDDFLNKKKIKTRWPSDYMKEFANHNDNIEATMATHLIDLDVGISDNDYDAFFDARCKAISEKLAAYIPPRSIDDGGPTISDDDIDPDAEIDEQEEVDVETTV